jgi:hypothetical protein
LGHRGLSHGRSHPDNLCGDIPAGQNLFEVHIKIMPSPELR